MVCVQFILMLGVDVVWEWCKKKRWTGVFTHWLWFYIFIFLIKLQIEIKSYQFLWFRSLPLHAARCRYITGLNAGWQPGHSNTAAGRSSSLAIICVEQRDDCLIPIVAVFPPYSGFSMNWSPWYPRSRWRHLRRWAVISFDTDILFATFIKLQM